MCVGAASPDVFGTTPGIHGSARIGVTRHIYDVFAATSWSARVTEEEEPSENPAVPEPSENPVGPALEAV